MFGRTPGNNATSDDNGRCSTLSASVSLSIPRRLEVTFNREKYEVIWEAWE